MSSTPSVTSSWTRTLFFLKVSSGQCVERDVDRGEGKVLAHDIEKSDFPRALQAPHQKKPSPSKERHRIRDSRNASM